jgi:hypothetical protein
VAKVSLKLEEHNGRTAVLRSSGETPDVDRAVRPAPVTVRSTVLGAILAPAICYWVAFTQIRANSTDLVMMSLMAAALFPMILLFIGNKLVAAVRPAITFTRAEILTVYVMLTTTVGLAGGGYIPFLATSIAAPAYYATPMNGWTKWTFLLKPWSVVTDPTAIQGFHDGKSNFFVPHQLHVWLVPMMAWSGFLLCLTAWGYCVNVLFRRAWIDQEKLLFPIAQIPLEFTRTDESIWKKRAFWLGIAVPAVVESIDSIHSTFLPQVPYIPVKPDGPLNLGPYLTTFPWNAMGYMSLAFYPLAIGLIFLMAADTSFSCWFLYLVGKIEMIVCAQEGWRTASAANWMPVLPDPLMQGTGGFVMLALLTVYSARHHLAGCIRKAFSGRGLDDSNEPLSYRSAVFGFIGLSIAVVAFATLVGMAWHVAAFLFASFLIMMITYTRIRAEAGLPWVMSALFNPHGLVLDIGGVNHYNTQDLTALSRFEWCDQDWRSSLAANQIDAMKIADTGRIRLRGLTVAIAIATVTALVGSWISCLHIFYKYGASTAAVCSWYDSSGKFAYDLLQGRVTNPTPPAIPRLSMFATGAGVTLMLTVLRRTFWWWPITPLGYVIANTPTMDWLWFPTFIGWFCKVVTMRYGGLDIYKRVVPFFVGLAVGDIVVSSLWTLLFLGLNIPGYRTYPI